MLMDAKLLLSSGFGKLFRKISSPTTIKSGSFITRALGSFAVGKIVGINSYQGKTWIHIKKCVFEEYIALINILSRKQVERINESLKVSQNH